MFTRYQTRVWICAMGFIVALAGCSREIYQPPRMAEDCASGLGSNIHQVVQNVDGFAWDRFGDLGCFPCAALILGGYSFVETRLGRVSRVGEPTTYPTKPGLYRYERIARSEENADACARFDAVNARMGHLVASNSAAFFGVTERYSSTKPEFLGAVKALYQRAAETSCVKVVEIAEFSSDYEVSQGHHKFLGNFPANGQDGFYSREGTVIRNLTNQMVLAESVDKYEYINPGNYGSGSGNSNFCRNLGTVIDVSTVLLPQRQRVLLEFREILFLSEGN